MTIRQTEKGYRLYVNGHSMLRNYINEMRQKELRATYKMSEIQRKEQKLKSRLREIERQKLETLEFTGLRKNSLGSGLKGDFQNSSKKNSNKKRRFNPEYFGEYEEEKNIPKVKNMNLGSSNLRRLSIQKKNSKLKERADNYFDELFMLGNNRDRKKSQDNLDEDKTLLDFDNTLICEKSLQNPFD